MRGVSASLAMLVMLCAEPSFMRLRDAGIEQTVRERCHLVFKRSEFLIEKGGAI